jgi:uncharacterized membrane protein
MSKARLEAFSDGVIAILITVLVLELKLPHGEDWAALRGAWPQLSAYVLSFAFLGIYWNNHHHLLHASGQVNGKVLWANLYLLFWLSLIPYATGWMSETHLAAVPTAFYGAILLCAGVAYLILQRTLIAADPSSKLKEAIGRTDLKGNVSALLYATAIPLAFYSGALSALVYVTVALIWLVPDSRIEKRMRE